LPLTTVWVAKLQIPLYEPAFVIIVNVFVVDHFLAGGFGRVGEAD
jgi:hypothetical protein